MADRNESIGDVEGYAAVCAQRSLENSFPILRSFLRPGMSVLDVGCGPGTVSCDVASYVQPGSVVGVDLLPEMVERAREAAHSKEAVNVTFQQGNSYGLDFPDNTFDLTYSLNMMVHLTDPVGALREQARVTKHGGLVLANIGDYGAKIMYPSCPALERVIAALAHLNDASHPATHIDFFLGRKALALFADAGLTEVLVLPEASPLMLAYQGTPNFQLEYEMLQGFIDPEDSLLGEITTRLLQIEVIDKKLLAEAQEELQRWCEHPHALMLDQVAFWGIGKVK